MPSGFGHTYQANHSCLCYNYYIYIYIYTCAVLHTCILCVCISFWRATVSRSDIRTQYSKQSSANNFNLELMFSIITDIIENINSKLKLFADDCLLYHVITSERDTMALQKDLDTLVQWHLNGKWSSTLVNVLSWDVIQ